MTDFQAWLAAEKAILDAQLDELLPPADTYPTGLHRAIRAGVLGGGKRLRGAMVRGLCAALGADPDEGLTVACAVECFHAATLVLDDLPCMDDAATRRGRPALHREFGESTAVLAAESLMMRAVELLTRPGRDGLPADAPAAALLEALADATGSEGLMAGQFLDLQYEDQAVDLQTLEAIHARKTGRLFRFCGEAAALLAGADETPRDAAVDYASAIGLAFQISDDLLDAVGDADALGKPTGQDANKATYVTHFGLEGARERLADAVSIARAALDALPGATGPLSALGDYLLTRTT